MLLYQTTVFISPKKDFGEIKIPKAKFLTGLTFRRYKHPFGGMLIRYGLDSLDMSINVFYADVWEQ